MNGWILYREPENALSPEAYEIQKLVAVGKGMGLQIQVVAPEQFDLVVTRDDRKGVLLDGKETSLPDFVIPRLGAATTYFALAVIRHLERLGVQMFNSSQSIETVKDKLYTHQILAQSNLPVAKTMLAKFPVNLDKVENHLGFPVVVKTLSGSQGTGVFLCEDRGKLQDLMELVVATKSNVNIIIQEFVASSRGRDLRVFTIGGRAVACMLRESKDGSFKANFSRGGEASAFAITSEIEWLSTEVARLLELDIAGIDLLFDGDHYSICEANSSPGFEGIESCHEIDMAKQIYSFIAVRQGRFEYFSDVASSGGSEEASIGRSVPRSTSTTSAPTRVGNAKSSHLEP